MPLDRVGSFNAAHPCRPRSLRRTAASPLLEDAKGLFNATVRDARAPDGADGIVYTVDWEGKPVVRERVRWPIVEAMGTAYALYTVTGDRQYETRIRHGGSTALST